MEIKNNYFLGVIVFFFEIFISMAFALPICILLSDKDAELMHLLKMSLGFLVAPIGAFILFSVLNFIITLFTKPKLILFSDRFMYKDEICYYSDVTLVGFDLGFVSKTSSEPTCLVLYRKDKPGIVIKSPSVRMIYHMRKKCYNRPFHIENLKTAIFIFIMFIVIGILYGIFGS
ncbi:MAG: hypothetical protein IJX78_02040 [Bacilli bacterium]|nr:hypothetical protein [Bacilli bacterium]